MKLRTLALVLFAACGGKEQVVLIDAPDVVGPGFKHTLNDMVYISFGNMMSAKVQTPAEDQPDNQEAPLTIESTGSRHITGNHGSGGDTGDDYVERDTYLITTAADVDQLTIRMDWDGGAADLDYFLFAIPETEDAEPFEIVRGTLISNDRGEFQTVAVDPNTSYWLWTGAFNMNAPNDGTAPGGSPQVPIDYHLSVYGNAFSGADVGPCGFTEASDATNDRLYVNGAFNPMASTGVPETSNQVVTVGSNVICGTINPGHFVQDAQDPSFGYVDVDTFSLTATDDARVVVTISGATPADDALIQELLGFEVRILNGDGLFFENAFYSTSHGAFSLRMPSTIDDEGMETGPKSIGIIAYGAAAITTPINYKIKVTVDDPDTRAPRLVTPADLSEANDD